ncbi:hypothetical protein V1525DRAFT_433127 [Lipomyces kononenkoae]|uniref:Uncharacterized protein n=1 Tax=Lipomyces kononenkoae TaxID=34357 RepID=A0ACC3SZV1_LIPKO
MLSPSPSPSPPSSRPDTPALSADMTSPNSVVAPRSPSLSSTSSLSIKRPLSDAADEDEGSPRVLVLEDTSFAADGLDDLSGDAVEYKRPVPLRLPGGERQMMDVDDERPRSAMSNWTTISSSPQHLEYQVQAVLPSREDQISTIKRLCNIPMEEGQTWYVIAKNWWDKFTTSEAGQDIGPIDNTSIIGERQKLKSADECEFEIVSESAWQQLRAWFGESEDSEAIARTAVNTSPFSRNIEVEVYPPVYSLHHLTTRSSDSSLLPSLVMSRASSYAGLEAATKDRLDIRGQIRIWKLQEPPPRRLDVERFKLIQEKEVIDGKDESLQDLGLGMDAALAIEEKSPFSDEWVTERKDFIGSYTSNLPSSVTNIGLRNRTTTTTSTTHSARPTPKRTHNEQSARTKGTTGLSNLGNTCYMNSALQCLTHVEELTKYFLVDAYKAELNPQNPLGMDGKVASAYAHLIHNIFGNANTMASFVPREIKGVIGRYGPMFSGYGQHDSQEFLAFLLDGLHEDLNRILKKPYTEKPELRDDQVDSKQAVVELANKCWELHRMRNDSIIQDLFAGMYKSTLVCPVCNKVSITFDPFMDLTLPLPIDNTWSKEIYFVPAKGRPVKVDVEVNGGASVKEYKAHVAKIMNVDPKKVISASIYSNKFFSFHKDSDMVSDKIDSNEDGFLYELDDVPMEPDYSDIMIFPVLNRTEKIPGDTHSREIFGYPFLITLNPTEASSYEKIYEKLVKKYKGMSTNNVLAEWGKDDGDIELGSPSRPEIFTVNAVSSYGRTYKGLNAVFSRLDGGEDIRDRYEKAKARAQDHRNKLAMLRPPVDPVGDTDEEGRVSAEIDNDNVVAAVAEDPKDSALQPLGLTNEAAPEYDDNADEHWLDASRGNSSDIEMQDASDKENNSAVGPGFLLPNGIGQNEASDDDSDRESLSMASLFDSADKPQHAASTYGPQLPSYGAPSWESDGSTSAPESYVTMGESLVCYWNKEVYDACFGGADDSDNLRGQPVWNIIETVVSEDLQQKRARRRTKQGQDISLEDCLNLFSKPEVLGQDDLWYCPRCKKHQQAVKTFEIWKVPDIFAVHLKRFSSSSRRDKIDVKIDFPVEGLDLSDRVGDPGQSQNPEHLIYDLFAVDNHFGGLGGGHYTANVKNFIDGKWYYFDDSSVRPVSAEDGVTAAAYMLFYRRRSSTPLGSAKLHDGVSSSTTTQDNIEAPSSSLSEKENSSPASLSNSPPPYGEPALPNASYNFNSSPSSSSNSSSSSLSAPRFPGEGRTLGRDGIGSSSTSWPTGLANRHIKYGVDLGMPKGSALLGVGKDITENPPPAVAINHSRLLNSDTLDDDTDDLSVVFADDDAETTDVSEVPCDAVVAASGIDDGEDVVEIKPEPDFDDDETVDDIHVDSDACA